MIDFSNLRLTRRPNQYLVTPNVHGKAKAHRESPVFSCSAEMLARRLKDVALARPRVTLSSETAGGRRLEFVARSRLFRFPDLISVEILPVGSDRATLAIYARAKYGYRDFGVNKARIDAWLDALATADR